MRCPGNGASPQLRHAHPTATAEPVQRHDGGWHLCIFSFCCIARRAGNEGCGQAAARMQQPVLCAPPVGTAAASEGGSTTACENAVYGKSCLFPRLLGCSAASCGAGAVLGRQSWAMLPAWGTGQPPLALRDQRRLYWPGVMLYPARYLGTFWCRFPHVLN